MLLLHMSKAVWKLEQSCNLKLRVLKKHLLPYIETRHYKLQIVSPQACYPCTLDFISLFPPFLGSDKIYLVWRVGATCDLFYHTCTHTLVSRLKTDLLCTRLG